MDKETFRKRLLQGQLLTKRAPAGKANWEKIKKKVLKDGGVYTTKQFWQKFVKKIVNRGRTKLKLHQWCDEERICARIYDTDRRSYVWIFDKELVKIYFEQLDAQRKAEKK